MFDDRRQPGEIFVIALMFLSAGVVVAYALLT